MIRQLRIQLDRNLLIEWKIELGQAVNQPAIKMCYATIFNYLGPVQKATPMVRTLQEVSAAANWSIASYEFQGGTMLTKEAFERSRSFVERNARPLEKVRLRFHFDRTPASLVSEELEKFQNADGGFGHALEPDLRTPVSSALATSVAFQILRETGGDPGATVADAVDYLLRTCDGTRLSWRIIPEIAAESPHAPWWNQAGLEEGFNHFQLNPTAEILGYLHDYQEFVPPNLIAELSEAILARLAGLERLEMHDFLCCKRLVETKGLDDSFRIAVLNVLRRSLDSTVIQDPSQWDQYGLRPLQAAGSPDAALFAPLQQAIDRNLDYEIAAQQADGSWPVAWSWGDQYPNEWERAAVEWKGVLSVEKLVVLKRYGRIEDW